MDDGAGEWRSVNQVIKDGEKEWWKGEQIEVKGMRNENKITTLVNRGKKRVRVKT